MISEAGKIYLENGPFYPNDLLIEQQLLFASQTKKGLELTVDYTLNTQ